jgi:hypothetical protein
LFSGNPCEDTRWAGISGRFISAFARERSVPAFPAAFVEGTFLGAFPGLAASPVGLFGESNVFSRSSREFASSSGVCRFMDIQVSLLAFYNLFT